MWVLQQAASAGTARALDRAGALAVMVSARGRYLVKRSAVTLGRTTSTHGKVGSRTDAIDGKCVVLRGRCLVGRRVAVASGGRGDAVLRTLSDASKAEPPCLQCLWQALCLAHDMSCAYEEALHILVDSHRWQGPVQKGLPNCAVALFLHGFVSLKGRAFHSSSRIHRWVEGLMPKACTQVDVDLSAKRSAQET